MTSLMKKSQQSKNKNIVLNLSKNNTRAKLDSLGSVELKHVSYGNTHILSPPVKELE